MPRRGTTCDVRRANSLSQNPCSHGQVNGPRSLALDANGNLYIADFANFRIRRISPNGIIATIAGNGKTGWTGDGGPATAAALGAPLGMLFDQFGALLFTSTPATGQHEADLCGESGPMERSIQSPEPEVPELTAMEASRRTQRSISRTASRSIRWEESW